MQTNKAYLANWLDVWAKLLYGLMDVGGPSQRDLQSHIVFGANYRQMQSTYRHHKMHSELTPSL